MDKGSVCPGCGGSRLGGYTATCSSLVEVARASGTHVSGTWLCTQSPPPTTAVLPETDCCDHYRV